MIGPYAQAWHFAARLYLSQETRAIRDLLRRRMLFARQQTADILRFQSMITRNTGSRMPVNNIKKLTEESLGQLFSNPGLFFLAQRYLNLIERLSQQIKMIEKQAMGTIITRFEKVGNYCSYCRCVSSERISNRENQILIP